MLLVIALPMDFPFLRSFAPTVHLHLMKWNIGLVHLSLNGSSVLHYLLIVVGRMDSLEQFRMVQNQE